MKHFGKIKSTGDISCLVIIFKRAGGSSIQKCEKDSICKVELKEPFVLNKFKTTIIIYKSKGDSSVNFITAMLKKQVYGIGNYLKRCKHSKKNFTDVIVRHTIVSFFF